MRRLARVVLALAIVGPVALVTWAAYWPYRQHHGWAGALLIWPGIPVFALLAGALIVWASENA